MQFGGTGARVAQWISAQAASAVPLARAAVAVGALDDRLSRSGAARPGLTQRLALIEAGALCRLAGEAREGDRLARDWAAAKAGARASLLARLAARLAASDTDTGIPAGDPAVHPLVAALCVAASEAGPATAVSRTLVFFAAAAARIGAAAGRGGLCFLPLADAIPLLGEGPAALAVGLAAVERSCWRSLDLLDRIERWRGMAGEAVAGWTGRTPGLLLDVLARWPAATAALSESESGASRAAVQRNLDRLVDKGLVREITGRGRYRVWTAALPDQSM